MKSFEEFLSTHRDEVEALQFFYAQPHKGRLRYRDIKALADDPVAAPLMDPEALWRAYETLEKSKVRGASAGRLLTDMVSLVRFALHKDSELVPTPSACRPAIRTGWRSRPTTAAASPTSSAAGWT